MHKSKIQAQSTHKNTDNLYPPNKKISDNGILYLSNALNILIKCLKLNAIIESTNTKVKGGSTFHRVL